MLVLLAMFVVVVALEAPLLYYFIVVEAPESNEGCLSVLNLLCLMKASETPVK